MMHVIISIGALSFYFVFQILNNLLAFIFGMTHYFPHNPLTANCVFQRLKRRHITWMLPSMEDSLQRRNQLGIRIFYLRYMCTSIVSLVRVEVRRDIILSSHILNDNLPERLLTCIEEVTAKTVQFIKQDMPCHII